MKLEINLKDISKRYKIKRIAKALSDLTRLEILHLIANDEAQNLNYGEISKNVERSPTSITNHMKWIRKAGIINDLVVEGKRGKMQKIPRLKITQIVINLD